MVEGPSEYMLIDLFFKNKYKTTLESKGIQVLAIRGLNFKRYLDVSKLLNNNVAVITDNDNDYQKNVEQKYKEYSNRSNIKVFSPCDNNINTFEVALYQVNKELCDKLFNNVENTTNCQKYMLNNKVESAYKLLGCNESKNIKTPDYIEKAIKWIMGCE